MEESRSRRFWMQLLSGFLGALILIVPIYMAVWFLRVKTLEDEPPQEQAARGVEGLPVEAEGCTVTLLLEDGEELMAALLLRADPSEKRLAVCGLPGSTVVLEAKKPKLLCEIYRESGSAAAAAALRDTLFIETDGYLLLRQDQFVRCVDNLGGFPITLLHDTELYDEAGLLELRLWAGTSNLTGQQALSLARACSDGRLDLGAEAITSAAMAFSEGGLGEAAAVVYAVVTGDAESDLTPLSIPDITSAFSALRRDGMSVAVVTPEGGSTARVELAAEDLRQIEKLFK